MIGQRLGAYTITRELGRGGMGAVFTATHNMLGRQAAVKVLLPELSRNTEVVERFFNEARAATAIKHPSIVEIYDFGWAPDGSAYIVMELMDGEPLSARLERHRRLPLAGALTIARQIATALAAAHRAGIVHRDLKPDNVFLVPDPEVVGGERVKLLDFGIAKLAVEGVASRTSTGMVLGTPVYMSPEQCQGAKLVDARSDLYSLGCMLFEMLSGRPPFVSEGVGELIGMHQFVAPPTLRSVVPDAPPDVDALIARLLAKSPTDRYQTAADVAAALSGLGAASQSMPAMAAMSAAASSATMAAVDGGLGRPPSLPLSLPPHPSTTLSHAAGVAVASSPPRRARTGLWLGLGGAGVAAAAIVVVAATSGGGSEPAGARVPAEAAVVDAGGATVATVAPPVDASVSAPPVDADSTPPVDAAEAVAVAVDAGVDAAPARTTPARRTVARDKGVVGDGAGAGSGAGPGSGGIGSGGIGSGGDSERRTSVVGSLSRQNIAAGMSRVRPRIAACGEQSYAKGTVRVLVWVTAAGSVSSVTVKQTPDAALGACVARAVEKAVFAKSENGGSFLYPVVF